MFGSNDYLDLITHPKVKEAAVQAVKKYGSGCSGSRLLNGTLDLHVKLEAELAAFVHKEAALTFGTGFQANYATLSALTEKGDVMICDHNLHASLVEGALRSPARTVRFRHNDMEPVSYTHLDVYKRQTWWKACSSPPERRARLAGRIFWRTHDQSRGANWGLQLPASWRARRAW